MPPGNTRAGLDAEQPVIQRSDVGAMTVVSEIIKQHIARVTL